MDGNKFTAGDDSGRTLNVDSPWASQEVADYILESVYGYEYQPFTATNVIVDPSVEIGDVLNFGVSGKCCFHQNTVYGKSLVSTMGAMEEKELDHDYKYKSSSSWGTGRALAGLEKKQEELYDSFGVELDNVRSALDVYVKETEDLQEASAALTTRVSGAETALEMNTQAIDDLQDASVEVAARVDGAEASIKLNAQNINGVASSVATIQADVVELKGRVDVTGSISVSDGGISADKNITAKGNIHVKGAAYFDSDSFFIAGTKYAPTEITSTSGAVLVLVTA